MAGDTTKDIEALREEVSKLRTDITDIAETLRKLSHDAVADGRDRLRDAAKQQTDKARESLSGVESEIEQRPLTSVAAAFGIGFVLGKLLDR